MKEKTPKKLLLAATILAVLLSGCATLDSWRDSIRQKASTAYDKAQETAEEVGYKYEETKNAVTEKVEDVRDAAQEVKEAVDAVEKVTGDL